MRLKLCVCVCADVTLVYMPDKKCHLPFTEKHTNTDTNSHTAAEQGRDEVILYLERESHLRAKM